MNAFAFDTHAFVKRLTAVGMPEAQAEALADEQVRLIDDRLATKEDIARLGADIARLEAATKADIQQLEAATRADIAGPEAAIKTMFAATKVDALKWVAGMLGFQTIVILGALFGLLRLFVH